MSDPVRSKASRPGTLFFNDAAAFIHQVSLPRAVKHRGAPAPASGA